MVNTDPSYFLGAVGRSIAVQFLVHWCGCGCHNDCLSIQNVQFKIIYICGKAHYLVSQKFLFPNVLFLTNNSSVRLIDNGPLSSLYASLLQAIDGVIYLAVCPHVMSQAPQHRSSVMQATCQ